MIFAIGFVVFVLVLVVLLFPLAGEPLPGQTKPWSPLTPVVKYMSEDIGPSDAKYPRWLVWITTAILAPVWAIDWMRKPEHPKKPRQQINCGDRH